MNERGAFAIVSLLACLVACAGCKAPMIYTTRTYNVYQYGLEANTITAEVTKDEPIVPVNVSGVGQ
jgi:hypothetical protein